MAQTQHDSAGADNPMAALLSADDLQRLVARHEIEQMEHVHHARSAKEEAKKARMDLLRQRRELTPEMVQHAIQRWQAAASQGGTEVELLRFPSELCSDDGRAINSSEPDWPRTLVGVPAQLYEIWAQHLKDRGFKLKAYVVDFPDGKPGDIGMFLSWV
ncbi:MAG: hypothetical protein H7Y60_08860 [Rhodospirillaceae bacterium]|nr:hypothetical protein [Rhodospirillales bacterium]